MNKIEKEKEINGVLMYRCYTCKEFLQLEKFPHTSKTFLVKKEYQCKKCHLIKVKESYIRAEGKEKQRLRYKNLPPDKKLEHSLKCKSRYWDNIPKTIWENARDRALRYNIEFDLKLEDLIIPEKCPLLDVPFKGGTKEDKWFTWSLDRIDSTKGYTKDNVMVITYLANTMKNKASKEQLISFSKNILKLMT